MSTNDDHTEVEIGELPSTPESLGSIGDNVLLAYFGIYRNCCTPYHKSANVGDSLQRHAEDLRRREAKVVVAGALAGSAADTLEAGIRCDTIVIALSYHTDASLLQAMDRLWRHAKRSQKGDGLVGEYRRRRTQHAVRTQTLSRASPLLSRQRALGDALLSRRRPGCVERRRALARRVLRERMCFAGIRLARGALDRDADEGARGPGQAEHFQAAEV